jgi:hypothetical protein
MATAQQIEANRRNAQQSTGPKTTRGKARARLNALKHGFRAQVVPNVIRRNPFVVRNLRHKNRRWPGTNEANWAVPQLARLAQSGSAAQGKPGPPGWGASGPPTRGG